MKETLIFFNTAIAWGGGEKWHFEVAQRMYSNGYKVCVICHPRSELLIQTQKAGLPHQTITISNISVFWPGKWLQLFKILKSLGPIKLIINLSRDLKIGSLVGRWVQANRIIYRRGSAIPIKNTLLNRWIFGSGVDEILANSQATKNSINAIDPNLFPSDKITVIYNGIETNKFAQSISDNKIYTRKGDELVLLHLGRLEYEKNQLFLVEVGNELQKRGISFHLLLGGSGSMEAEIQSSIKTYGLEQHISLVGFVDNPPNFFAVGDVFLLPSLWEGFGFVLAEAGASQKPAIGFDTGSIPEIIIDQKTGFITPLGDLHLFCDALEKFSNDRSLVFDMGQLAKKHVIQNFDLKHINRAIETYLTQE